jgi:hypothetical protein
MHIIDWYVGPSQKEKLKIQKNLLLAGILSTWHLKFLNFEF